MTQNREEERYIAAQIEFVQEEGIPGAVYPIFTNSDIPAFFVDEKGNRLEEIDWGPWSVLARRELKEGEELHDAGWYATQCMGVIIQRIAK